MPEFVKFVTIEGHKVAIHWQSIECVIEKGEWTEIHCGPTLFFTANPVDVIEELINQARIATIQETTYD